MCCGGEGGIRTLETFRSATLAVWCLQPLGHLSMRGEYSESRGLSQIFLPVRLHDILQQGQCREFLSETVHRDDT